MKTLTIRLDDQDLKRIEEIQSRTTCYSCTTINGTIRYALKLMEEYTTLRSELAKIFTHKWEVDQKKFKELNNKYGFLQRNLFE